MLKGAQVGVGADGCAAHGEMHVARRLTADCTGMDVSFLETPEPAWTVTAGPMRLGFTEGRPGSTRAHAGACVCVCVRVCVWVGVLEDNGQFLQCFLAPSQTAPRFPRARTERLPSDAEMVDLDAGA